MSQPVDPVTAKPFTSFNFRIELQLPGKSGALCAAAFSECEGLEMSMQVKTIREGGNAVQAIHLPGNLTYGQLTLKRGMTDSFDLWDWVESVFAPGGYKLRASGEVILLAEDAETVRARFLLTRCLPVKIRGPGLHAKDSQLAIEELQLVYETLELKKPKSTPNGS